MTARGTLAALYRDWRQDSKARFVGRLRLEHANGRTLQALADELAVSRQLIWQWIHEGAEAEADEQTA